MRTMNKNILIIICVISLFGCDDFLQESSEDLLIPKRLEEYIPLLYGEGYPHNFENNAAWIQLMTDNVEMGYLERTEPYETVTFDVATGGEGKYAYLWDYNIGEYINDNFWNGCYKNILGCNTIIKALPDMKYNKEEKGKFSYLAAQAYALRAYHYFCLINTYALPYSEENKSALGVVIRINPEIEEKPFPRATIEEVWTLIGDDIKKAREFMEESTPTNNLHLISRSSVLLLSSRIALFQEKWDDVIAFGDSFLKENNYIFDLNTIPEDKMGTEKTEDFYIMNSAVNKEIVFTFGRETRYYGYLSEPPSLYGLGFRVSSKSENSLIKSYDENDLRIPAYFRKDYWAADNLWEDETLHYTYNYPIKFKASGSNYHENWRTVEVYLNLAEAYARKNATISVEAIEILNKLRSNRIKKDSYADLKSSDFNSKDDLVKFVWEERRRELCFEELMRFWDLRRMGMPKIEHHWYSDKENFETYTLEKGGNNYVLQIPQSETQYNDRLKPNPRDVINRK